MKLQRDLLLVDFESFGEDLERSPIILLAALVIDKDSGLIKKSKYWYLKHSWLASVAEQHSRMLGVEVDTILNGQKPLDVAREFEKIYGGNLLLATSNSTKLVAFRYFFRKLTLPFPFDTPVLDLNTVYWAFGIKMGWKKTPSLPALSEHFGRKFKSFNDPVERLRLQAEILNKTLGQL